MDIPMAIYDGVGLIISGAFYDQAKTATLLSANLIKENIKQKLPFKKEEIDIIEAEIIDNANKYNSKEELERVIKENDKVQLLIKELVEREPQKIKDIVDSFKRNKKAKLDLSLGDSSVKNSFNDNKECEIIIR